MNIKHASISRLTDLGLKKVRILQVAAVYAETSKEAWVAFRNADKALTTVFCEVEGCCDDGREDGLDAAHRRLAEAVEKIPAPNVYCPREAFDWNTVGA